MTKLFFFLPEWIFEERIQWWEVFGVLQDLINIDLGSLSKDRIPPHALDVVFDLLLEVVVEVTPNWLGLALRGDQLPQEGRFSREFSPEKRSSIINPFVPNSQFFPAIL